jgi:DNA-binding CsgD family transcriptional regulator
MLTTSDYKKVLEIIDIAYATPDRETMFRAVSEKLEKLIGISSSAYIPWNARTNNFQFQGNILFSCSSQALRVYLDHFSAIDPYVESGSHLANPRNTAVKVTDFMPASRYAETPYARECAPLIPCFFEMNAMLGCQGDPLGGIALHRKRGEHDFRERDRKIINLILPHLARAVHHVELMEMIAASQHGGIVVVGAQGLPIFINPEARRVLNGRPIRLIPEPGNGSDPAFFKTEAGVYRVRTVPVRWSKTERIIFLEPHPPENEFSRLLLEQYALTGRQREIAILVIRGLSNREIAERLFIDEQTVKDHLHDAFEKMKIHHRSELAAKLLGLTQSAK